MALSTVSSASGSAPSARAGSRASNAGLSAAVIHAPTLPRVLAALRHRQRAERAEEGFSRCGVERAGRACAFNQRHGALEEGLGDGRAFPVVDARQPVCLPHGRRVHLRVDDAHPLERTQEDAETREPAQGDEHVGKGDARHVAEHALRKQPDLGAVPAHGERLAHVGQDLEQPRGIDVAIALGIAEVAGRV